jgi:hypothetical protein
METGELGVLFEKHEWKQQLELLDKSSGKTDADEERIVKMTNTIVENHKLHLVLTDKEVSNI